MTSALRTLYRLEFRLLRDRGVLPAIGLLLLLGAIGIVVGAETGTMAPGSGVALSPSPLQAMSVGPRGRLPSRAGPVNAIATMPTTLLPGTSGIPDAFGDVLGRFDLAFVLVWLLPVVIIALSYDMLSREREDGTLSLLLSQPLSVHQVVTAKLLARLPWLLVPALGLYAIAAGLRPSALTWREGVFIAAGAALVTLYCVFWLALCLWANVAARPRSSAANGLLLGAIWLGLVAVAPPLIDAAARARYAEPTRREVDLVTREWETRNAFGNRLHEEFYVRLLREHPEWGPPRPKGKEVWEDGGRAFAYLHYAYHALTPLAELMAQRFASRQRFVDVARYLSPAAVLSESLDEVAGMHERRVWLFERELRAHVDTLRTREFPALIRGQQMAPADRTSPFAFIEEPLVNTVARLAGAAVGLLLPTLFLFARVRRNIRERLVLQ